MYPVWRNLRDYSTVFRSKEQLTVQPPFHKGDWTKNCFTRDLVHYTLSPEPGLFSTCEPNSRFEFSSLVTILAITTFKITTTIKTIAVTEHASEGTQP